MKKFTFRLRRLLALKKQALRQAEHQMKRSQLDLRNATSELELAQQDALNRDKAAQATPATRRDKLTEVTMIQAARDRIRLAQEDTQQAIASYRDAASRYERLDSQTRSLELVESKQKTEHRVMRRKQLNEQAVEIAVNRFLAAEIAGETNIDD